MDQSDRVGWETVCCAQLPDKIAATDWRTLVVTRGPGDRGDRVDSWRGRHQALAELETVKDSKFLVNDSNQ